ncbi:MAG: hypothetical protein HN757_00930 [Calditrichaeota bacterium]|nr:hypothetical protein [Calditrichota bacterium]
MKKLLSTMIILTALLILCGISSAKPFSKALPPVNAYSAGLGMAGVAVGNDPATLYWNPGGVGLTNQIAVDISMAAAGFESPGNWSFIMLNSSDIDGNRIGFGLLRNFSEFEDKKEYKSYTVSLPLSSSFQSGSLPVGISVKYITENIEGDGWHHGMSLDFGSMWNPGGGVVFGYSTLNAVGSALRSFSHESWFGASWGADGQPISFSSQFRADELTDWDYISKHYSVGMNYAPRSMIAEFTQTNLFEFRGGYLVDGDEKWASFGIEVIKGENDSHIAYTMMVDPVGWKNRAHYISYGYSKIAAKKPALWQGR